MSKNFFQQYNPITLKKERPQQIINNAVQMFLESQQERDRNQMLRIIMMELSKLRPTRLWVGDYKVTLEKGAVRFNTLNYSRDSKCPGCGQNFQASRILTGAVSSEEECVYGCKCGTVYKVNWR